MVNRGRSGACQTCKARRVKCDETRPGCMRCERAGRECDGYSPVPTKIRFKDQSQRFSNVQKGTVVLAASAATRPKYPLSTYSQNAESFFGHLLCDSGRSRHSSRGFFDFLAPVLSSQRQDSALSLVVAAVAETFLDLWDEGSMAFQAPRVSFNRAVLRLRTAIMDSTERSDPATVMAILVLQFHENLSALFTHRQAMRLHLGGAQALLQSSDPKDKEPKEKGECTSLGAQLARYMASVEVSFATRKGLPVPQSAINRLGSSDSAAPPPTTPTLTLDALGASVANLKFLYRESSAHGKLLLSEEDDVAGLWLRINELNKQLKMWAEVMPRSCHPIRLHEKDFDASIPTYQSVCDIYPSCQIAAMWNLWRCYRLIVLKLRMALLRSHSSYFKQSESEFDFLSYSEEVQEVVDSICNSVPFYLGNRTAPCSVRDFSDPNLHFPSTHCLAAGDARLQSYGNKHHISKSKHQHHVLLCGLWHLLGPVSRLLTIFSEDHGWLITSVLREGQQEWIAGQLLRVNLVQRLNLNFTSNYLSGRSNLESAGELAKIVQQSLSLTSGL